MTGVCAIVVTYRPDETVWENIAAIRGQVDRVVIVDNASSNETRDRLARLAAADAGIETIANEDNRGIAAALNQGAARAAAAGFEWIATFDQDSRAPRDFVASLQTGLSTFAERERVAIVSPLYEDRQLGTVTSPSGPLEERSALLAVVSVTATSGNLVRVRALREIGGFREDFFIDCVDFEFCLRARRRGWLILEVRSVRLQHAQGRAQRRAWLGRQPVVNDYNAERRYYQARNRLIMYARFGAFDPRWIAHDAIGYASDLTKMLLFCADRPAKLGAVVTGWWHAASGRRGAWSPRSAAVRGEGGDAP